MMKKYIFNQANITKQENKSSHSKSNSVRAYRIYINNNNFLNQDPNFSQTFMSKKICFMRDVNDTSFIEACVP